MVKNSSPSKKTVLIIEDVPDLRQFQTWTLQAVGFTVLQAGDAATGLQILRHTSVDLVLLDLKLPDKSGWTVMEEIKADANLAAIAVVIASASADINNRSKALEMGAAEYLVKPIEADKLVKCIERLSAVHGE